MKLLLTTLSLSLAILLSPTQTATAQELHGSALNLGVGIGARQAAVYHINFEFDVVPSVTIAPSASFYGYTKFVPIGLKASYYFDQVLNLLPEWDLYVAGTAAMGIVSDDWNNQTYRDMYRFRGANNLFFDVHIGTEYQVTPRAGMFIDLASNAATIGIVLR